MVHKAQIIEGNSKSQTVNMCGNFVPVLDMHDVPSQICSTLCSTSLWLQRLRLPLSYVIATTLTKKPFPTRQVYIN